MQLKLKGEESTVCLSLPGLAEAPLFGNLSLARKPKMSKNFWPPPFTYKECPAAPPGPQSLDPEELPKSPVPSSSSSSSSSSSLPVRRGQPPQKKRKTGTSSPGTLKNTQWPGKSTDHRHGRFPNVFFLFMGLFLPRGKKHILLKRTLALPPGTYLLEPGLALEVAKGNDPFTNKPHATVSSFELKACVYQRSSEDLKQRVQAIEDRRFCAEQRQGEINNFKKKVLSPESSPEQDHVKTNLAYAVNHVRNREKDQQRITQLLSKHDTNVRNHTVTAQLDVHYFLESVTGTYNHSTAPGGTQ